MTKKTIWLINQYASTPKTGIGGRHYYLAKELAKQGHHVFLIAASYTHLLRTPPVVDSAVEIEAAEGFSLVWIKTPRYASAHSKKRVFNWLYFAWTLLSLPRYIAAKPDAIVFSSPALFGFLSAKWLASKFNAQLIFEVRDIWPLTLVELGGFSKHHPLIWLMQRIEDDAYRTADRVVSNLPNALEHMASRGMDATKFAWIPNGFSKEEIEASKPLPDHLLNRLPLGKFLIGYAGTIGLANALGTLIQAAERLRERKDIVIVIVGHGKDKGPLEQKVTDSALDNVIFVEPVDKNQIQSLLKIFDVCYLGWKRDNLYQFGTAANKLIDYFMSGKPVLHAYSGACDFVKIHNAGISVPAENAEAVADAIVQFKNLPKEDLLIMGQNGKNYASECHDYEKLAEKLAQITIAG